MAYSIGKVLSSLLARFGFLDSSYVRFFFFNFFYELQILQVFSSNFIFG